jgi:putative colanic acid biosynthesis UDP-glucose lipid carrier transferase
MITNKKSSYYLRLFLDLIILNVSFIIAASLAQSLKILLSRSYMFGLMMSLDFIWYFISNVIDFYEDFNVRSFTYQFPKILKNIIAQLITAVLFIFLTKENLFTRNFILYYTLLILTLISVRVQLLKIILTNIRSKGKNARNIIIIGAGKIGKTFYDFISRHTDFGYNILGFLDNNENDDSGIILGKINFLDKIITSKNIEEVIIALPIQASNEIDKIVKTCNKHAVRVHIIPDYFRFISKKYQISMIGNFPIITVRSEPLAEIHWQIAKRVFDLIVSILGIILILSWFIPLVFLLDLFLSPGPVFFVQDRVGAKDKIFKCYKFRTMHSGNKSTNQYIPTVENDPRITKLGKFLRKSNLDELPQLFNIVKGEMSLVGPRPHAVAYNEIYKEIVEEIKLRGWVKPGITGWAQIHGLRGDVPDFEENKRRTAKRIEFDIWYIENWSFGLDLQIILSTIWQMIKGDTKAL